MAGRSVNIIPGSPQPARAGRAAGIDAHPAKKRRSWGRPEPPSPGQLLMWCPPQQPVAPREQVYPAGSRGKAPPGGPGPAPPRAGPGRRSERGAGGALPLRLSGSFLGGSAADGAQTAAPGPSRPVPPAPPLARSLTGCPEAQATKLRVSASHTHRILPAEPARRPPVAGHKGESGAAALGSARGRGAGPRAPSGPFRSAAVGAPLRAARRHNAARLWGCPAAAAAASSSSSAALPLARFSPSFPPALRPECAAAAARLPVKPRRNSCRITTQIGSSPSQWKEAARLRRRLSPLANSSNFPPSPPRPLPPQKKNLRPLSILPSAVLPPSGKHEQRAGAGPG